MTLTPLFFLPRRARIWAFNQAMEERLLDTPFSALFWSADRFGVEFWYRGDTVIWTWPWRRKGLAPFVSLGMSGTGEWGDARFWTLEELDEHWRVLAEACQPLIDQLSAEIERQCIETLTQECHHVEHEYSSAAASLIEGDNAKKLAMIFSDPEGRIIYEREP